MNKITKILILGLFALITNFSMAQKFGHINKSELLLEVPGYKDAESELERYSKQKEAELTQIQQGFQESYEKYMKEKDALTETIRASREQELMEMQQSMQNFQQSASQKIQEKQQALIEPLLKNLDETIKKVGKEGGYTYIFDISSGFLVFYENGTNLNDKVKEELKKLSIAPKPNLVTPLAPKR